MNETKDLLTELEIIKKILIVQLVQSGITIRDVVKLTGLSSQTLYTFLPKNLAKSKN